MRTILLKRHKYKFYLTIIFGTIAFMAMGTVVLLTYFSIQHHKPLSGKQKLMPFVSVGIYAFAVYSLYAYYRNAPIVVADNTSIRIGSKTYDWADIDGIDLTGKRFFPYLISYAMESVAIHFRNGYTKYLYDDMYENLWELKSFLKQVIIEKQTFATVNSQPIDASEWEGDYFETYSGNQLTSFTGILLWGIILVMGLMAVFLDKGKNTFEAIVAIVLFAAILFLLYSRMMYYFKISDQYLLIKNQNFFWRKKVYRLSDIAEVVFEAPPKMCNSLRVITKDFKTTLYPAAPLRNKTWLAMKNKLEYHHITVRNECI